MDTQINLDHSFFDYISVADKAEIRKELKDGISVLNPLYDGETLRAAFIIMAYPEKIHIREIGGDYVWATKHVNRFAEKVAKAMGLNKVSFTASDETIQKRSEIYGYKPSADYPNEFERSV